MHRNCTSKVTYSQFMNDESQVGSIWRISAHHVDRPQPKGTDGHIKARRLSMCQYLCSSRQRAPQISGWMLPSILDDCLQNERVDIHEIGWFISIFSFTSKPVNIIQLASMKNATFNLHQADLRCPSLRVRQLHRGNTLTVRLLCAPVLTLKKHTGTI